MTDDDAKSCEKDDFYTTYYTNYQPHEAYNFPKLSKKIPQRDEMVITGHFRNNLLVNGRNMKSKVWPESNFGVEEYKNFVDRLQKCKKLIYDMFFRKPEVRTDIIEDMLRSLEKTVYQMSYSPNDYVTVSEARRIGMASYSANMKYHETTYRTYYNRIEELENFKDCIMGKFIKDDQVKIRRELQNMYITGRTTYYETICLPAIIIPNSKNKLESPIDIHSWRRV